MGEANASLWGKDGPPRAMRRRLRVSCRPDQAERARIDAVAVRPDEPGGMTSIATVVKQHGRVELQMDDGRIGPRGGFGLSGVPHGIRRVESIIERSP